MPPPRGGGALLRNLSDNSRGGSAASFAGAKGAGNGPQNEFNDANSLTPQEQLLAGTLELDPENDPVIYTTDYGLDIKWHMAGLPNNPNDIASVPSGQKFETYAYFTHANVNWVIIGHSNISTTLGNRVLNLANIAGYYQKVGYYNFTNTTSGIWQYLRDTTEGSLDAELTDVYANYGGFFYNQSLNTISQKDVFPNAAATDELEINEVLCLLSGNYANITFGSNNVYYSEAGVSSNLRTYINDTIYPLVKDLPIEPQPLTTAGSASTTEYLFPLGTIQRASTESFAVENYLDTATKLEIGANWWLRSGLASVSTRAYYVATGGVVYYQKHYVSASLAVRPAFVLQI